ncbi:hypothetical protein [Bifidobacterium samirii]|uniref:Uncharacterized protein n=1 Tax=Bifidobacterium samirii TaxID=2306974 RepID=A0A430FTI8_9BIFI|nr:hypothetical protein [Bifidobacterium samirii]RSX56225.1 hypothetical protein D2E24_1214 [Bifidobacterium samirii]
MTNDSLLRLPEEAVTPFGRDNLMTVGDLCRLTWDGETVGWGLVSGFNGDMVFMCPVTSGDCNWFGAVRLPFAEKLWVWPSYEMPMGKHLVDGDAGQKASPRWVRCVRNQIKEGSLDGFEISKLDRDDRREMILAESWEHNSHNTACAGGIGFLPFDPEKLSRRNIHVSDFRSAFPDMRPHQSGALYNGRLLPDRNQIQTVLNYFQLNDANDVLPDQPPRAVSRLCLPDLKINVKAVLGSRNEDEESVRHDAVERQLSAHRAEGNIGNQLRNILLEMEHGID